MDILFRSLPRGGKVRFKTRRIGCDILSGFSPAALQQCREGKPFGNFDSAKPNQITRDDLIRLLHSLSCAQVQDPCQGAKHKDYLAEWHLYVQLQVHWQNEKNQDPSPTGGRKEVGEWIDVDKDQRFTIDAAIVRIMKSRNFGSSAIGISVLRCWRAFSSRTSKQLRSEDLITREYLERDAENPNTFKYLAQFGLKFFFLFLFNYF